MDDRQRRLTRECPECLGCVTPRYGGSLTGGVLIVVMSDNLAAELHLVQNIAGRKLKRIEWIDAGM